MAVHVHVEHARLIPEEMIVQRGHFESVLEQRGHDRVDFVLRQDQVAHHHIHAPVPLVIAIQPPNPNGVGVSTFATVIDQVVPRNVHLEHIVFVVPCLPRCPAPACSPAAFLEPAREKATMRAGAARPEGRADHGNTPCRHVS